MRGMRQEGRKKKEISKTRSGRDDIELIVTGKRKNHKTFSKMQQERVGILEIEETRQKKKENKTEKPRHSLGKLRALGATFRNRAKKKKKITKRKRCFVKYRMS